MSKNSVKIYPGALVCEEVKLRGDITIGSGTIVHPGASIIAEAGPIVIGDNCLIEEQAKIVHRTTLDRRCDDVQVLYVGSNNVFEVDCCVEACRIGDGNVFESKCHVGCGVTVGDGCTVGAGCRVALEQTLDANASVFGEECLMREGLDKPVPQTLQMETLMKMLPNYHRIRKPNKKM